MKEREKMQLVADTANKIGETLEQSGLCVSDCFDAIGFAILASLAASKASPETAYDLADMVAKTIKENYDQNRNVIAPLQ